MPRTDLMFLSSTLASKMQIIPVTQYVLSHTIHSDLAPGTFLDSWSGPRWDGEWLRCLPWRWQMYLADHSSQNRCVPPNDFLIIPIHLWEGGVTSFTYPAGWVWLRTNVYRNTGERVQLQKQPSFFWMNITTGTSGPSDTVFHPLSLFSSHALWWQNWSFFLPPCICHWETRNDRFHFICWKPKAANILDIGANGA